MREALERLIEELDVGDRVSLLGAVPNSEVLDWLGGLHLLALACQRSERGDVDGVPVAMMEAMALGVPVVSTRISGIPELVQHGVSGLLTEPKDPSAFADAIRACVDDAALFEKLKRGARARVIEEFDENRNADLMADLIREIGR